MRTVFVITDHSPEADHAATFALMIAQAVHGVRNATQIRDGDDEAEVLRHPWPVFSARGTGG